jgi:uncharacterized membrane protein
MGTRVFVVCALLFGGIFAVLVPPFQVADEFNHFYRAWQISDGVLVGIRTSDSRLGGDLPVSVAKITQDFRSLPFQPNNRIKSNTIFYNLSVPLDADNRQFQDFTNTVVYAPTAYLPQIVAICIGKSLKIGPLSIFYFSRLLTLLFWLSMVYAALKIIPIKKNLFAALALLPASLFINASASGDVVTNACSFLLIAIFIKFIVEKQAILKLQNAHFCCLIVILSLIISLNKIAYFPIVFLIFLIKKEQFNGLKNKILTSSILIISNLSIIAYWSKTIQHLFIKFEDYNPVFRVGQQLNEKVDPSVQMAFMTHNPLIFSKIALFSLIKTFPHTLIHYVGKFGWEKNYLPLPIIATLVLLILIQAILNEKNQAIPTEQLGFSPKINLGGPLSIEAKFSLFCIAILMTFTFTAAMYALWNPVGSEFIENLGGKYFIPIYPLFLLALPYFDVSKNRFLSILVQPKILFGSITTSLIWSVYQVLMRYYEF